MVTTEGLQRAAAYLPPALRPRLFNPQVRPHWIGQTDRFWYRREGPDGIRFVVTDAASGATALAFDHEAAAVLLTGIIGSPVPAGALPVVEVDPDGGRVKLADGRWVGLADGAVSPAPLALRPGEVASPDGSQAVFCRGHDLWLRDIPGGGERRLTHDGAVHFAYGKSPDSNLITITLRRRGIVLPANVLWSPDGRYLLTSRLDERAVLDLALLQHAPGGPRPVLHSMKFAYAGDAAVPLETHCVIEVATGAVRLCPAGPHVTGMTTCIEKEEAWWTADSTRVHLLDRDRSCQRLSLLEIDAASGAVREVFTETVETFIDTNLSVAGLPNFRVLAERGEFIWFSQADGWAHLYLRDLATGALKHRITEGAFVVRDIVHVGDGFVEILAGGLSPNPYHRTLCRVGLDGSGFTVLTPGSDDHLLAMPAKRLPRDHIRPPVDAGAYRAPSGRFFVHTHADLTTLPVSEVRRADGSLVAVLETAALDADLPWRWPVPFTALAADGQTEIFGAMWLPVDFDPARLYPVIDYIYPGPQIGKLPTVMLTDTVTELGRSSLPQAFAELGCIVINVDGRGTPLRSKAFHDTCYGRMDDPGTLADHVATLRQLAGRHAWFDISRVGIMGHSGGGYASVRAMLEYPDVFHVGVATSGNHDQMGYSAAWAEKYMGPIRRNAEGGGSYASAANPPYAANLQGKLLLATGDMDDNVHPALTMQLAAALIEADRDFEFIPLPNDDHTTVWSKPYFLRRAMAFLATHLRM